MQYKQYIVLTAQVFGSQFKGLYVFFPTCIIYHMYVLIPVAGNSIGWH